MRIAVERYSNDRELPPDLWTPLLDAEPVPNTTTREREPVAALKPAGKIAASLRAHRAVRRAQKRMRH
jgi:hypothetical protein